MTAALSFRLLMVRTSVGERDVQWNPGPRLFVFLRIRRSWSTGAQTTFNTTSFLDDQPGTGEPTLSHRRRHGDGAALILLRLRGRLGTARERVTVGAH